jgi:hypothetical protein
MRKVGSQLTDSFYEWQQENWTEEVSTFIVIFINIPSLLGSCFSWGSGSHLINCVYSALKLLPDGFVYHPLPIHGWLSLEGFRDNIYAANTWHTNSINIAKRKNHGWLWACTDSAEHRMIWRVSDTYKKTLI